jgi:hypothetical protein
VEGFKAELQARALGDIEVFQRGEVPVELVRSLEDVAAGAAEGEWRRGGEGGRVDRDPQP